MVRAGMLHHVVEKVAIYVVSRVAGSGWQRFGRQGWWLRRRRIFQLGLMYNKPLRSRVITRTQSEKEQRRGLYVPNPDTASSAGDSSLIQSNAENKYTVTAAELPLHCPMDGMSLWNSHPRVFLSIEETGHAKCPYCGAEYTLEG